MVLMKTMAVTNDAKISLFQVKPRFKSNPRMVTHCFRNEEIRPGHSAGLRVPFSFHLAFQKKNSDSFQNLWKVSTDTVENAEGAL